MIFFGRKFREKFIKRWIAPHQQSVTKKIVDHGFLHEKLSSPEGGHSANMLLKYISSIYDRPRVENAIQWQKYFLTKGTESYLKGQYIDSLNHLKSAVKVRCIEREAWCYFYDIFCEYNQKPLKDFSKAMKGGELVVAHISCNARMPLALQSAESFSDSCVKNVVVVGNEDLPAYQYRFEIESSILEVPANDFYEGLPQKVAKFFLFLGASSVDLPVLKVDDEILCNDLGRLKARLSDKIRKYGYGGGHIVDNPLLEECSYWHLNKCSEDKEINNTPYGMLFIAPYVEGAYYWLNSETAAILSKAVICHEDYIKSEIYEDRAIGGILHRYGIRPTLVDLVGSGVLRRVTCS